MWNLQAKNSQAVDISLLLSTYCVLALHLLADFQLRPTEHKHHKKKYWYPINHWTGLGFSGDAASEPIFALFEYWIFISHPSILYNASLMLICWQEVDIAEPCSCICYSPDFVLFGTDTVYKLSVHTGVIRPFLVSGVKPNTSYHSLPIDVLCVTGEATRGDNSTAEFIVCFTGVYDESQFFLLWK